MLYADFRESGMSFLHGPGRQCILAVACLGSAATARAACTGPPALTAKLRAQPTSDNAVLLGNWYASHKQFDCAVATFRKAIQADPKRAQLHYLEGLALVDGGHPEEATPALQESIRLEPDVIKPHLMLAHIYDVAGEHAEAEEQWKQGLAIDPHSEFALEGLSGELLTQQDYAAVVELLKDAPRTEKLAINLARALGLLNYLDQANLVLTEALKLSPRSLPLVNAVTVVLIKQHRYLDAINLLEKAEQQHPGNWDAQEQLFRVMVLTNHLENAAPLGAKLLAQFPHDGEILYLNGVLENAQGDYADAKAHLEEAAARDPNSFSPHFDLGKALVKLKEWKEAKEELEKSIALGETAPPVHFELAQALRGLGDNDGAQAEMERFQQLKKSSEANLEAASSSAQGDAALAAGKVSEAVDRYREAADGEPGNANYKFKLAIALHRSGDAAGERTQLEEAVKLKPDLAGAQKQLGYLMARSGDTTGAIEHLRMAVQAAPGWVDAWISLAGELAENGDFNGARDAVGTALRLDSNNAEARELSDQLARDPAAQQAHP